MLKAPDVVSLTVLIITLAALGSALDTFVLKSRLKIWRTKVRRLWKELNTPGARGLTQHANQLFTDLFDHVYGTDHFSNRRVKTSAISTTLGLLVFTLLVGLPPRWSDLLTTGYWTPPFFELQIPIPSFFKFLLGGLIVNYVADFVSLIETRLILRLSRDRGLVGVLLLLVVDFVLTSLIFLGILELILIFPQIWTYLVTDVQLRDELRTLIRELSSAGVLSSKGLLVFYLSTFVTSMFWALYVLSFLIVLVLHRLSPLANFVYVEIVRSDRPAAAFTAFLNGLLIIGYVAWVMSEYCSSWLP